MCFSVTEAGQPGARPESARSESQLHGPGESLGLPEAVRVSRRLRPAVFGGHTPIRGTLEARPAKRRGSAAGGDRHGVGWLERPGKNVFSVTGAGGPAPRPESA
jgi:hypothetical protein